jgi:AcrR family transcriptional regulator
MTLDQASAEVRQVGAVPPDNRREDMLRAALHVIAARGFADTRIADVAERAGTSPALVIYYFQSKDNLLTEAIRLAEDRWFEQGIRRLSVIPDPVGQLEEIVTWICIPVHDDEFPDPWSLWIDLWARSQRHPAVAQVRQEFDTRWRSAISRVVTDGQVAGDYRPTDSVEFAIALLALLDGLAVQMALGDPAVNAAFVLRTAMGFASLVLGFTWEGAPQQSAAPAT